ncbi:ImpA family metalloprotease [Photobacterium sp. GJ3]|uniref:ImpA family metalloprotease n=1 Tax=Photobacterium sp. GJ3 TaxID=2829502 RepID=UPI001B8C3D1D|nr:ImpA family metalloprotease [Photobacterium sp. GJ3]QUJ68051.1 ImpA family metalloprotease [Photobacterium sp. GJ3]
MKPFSLFLLCLSLTACGGGSDSSNQTAGNSGSSDAGNSQSSDAIQRAVKAGDPRLLPTESSVLEQRISSLIATEQHRQREIQAQIFGHDRIEYDPGQHSRFFTLQYLTSAQALLSGVKGNLLATLSEQDGRRSAAFGTNILRELNAGEHSAFAPQMNKVTDWLLSSRPANPHVALMLISNSHSEQSKRWLQSRYPQMTFSLCTDEARLADCLSSADLVITGTSNPFSQASVAAALDSVAARKQPLLYVHTNSWNSTPDTNLILSYFGVQTQAVGGAGNYFAQDKASWASAVDMRQSTDVLSGIAGLIQHFSNHDFSFRIQDCEDDNQSCSNITAFEQEFLTPVTSLRQIVRQVDASGTDIFALPQAYPLEKHLILLADQYRQQVQFPMSKNTTATVPFLKSYFADHLTYYSRQINPVQSDLGNFSRTNFSHVTPISKTVRLTSRRPWRAAGVYALPGQRFTVTRTDNHTGVAATVFINTQRATSTKPMTPANGYHRPKYLQSSPVTIQAGETITLTSPYGGPVQIGFSDLGTPMTFSFRQVAQHPYWQPGMSDAAFQAALESKAFDWAELTTEHFEIHSRNDRMLTTLSENSRWDSASDVAPRLTRYHHSALRALAGYQGENITPIAEVQSFATQHGLTLPVWDQVQHMNADQPTCGYGCSGNPYDAGWAFSVLGHGDLHEVGHNVESGRFKFNGYEGHATTNFYSYYPKSLAAVQESGYAHQCQSLPFDQMLADIRQSQLSADPAAYMAGRNDRSWSQGAALIVQMMMHAQHEGKLSNGWHLIARLHLLDKAFADADNSEENWQSRKASIGFSTYTLSEAKSLDNNDWLLIAASYATGLDYRPYLDLMGQPYSSKASSQVASFSYAAVDKAFFNPATNSDYCDSLIQPQVHF